MYETKDNKKERRKTRSRRSKRTLLGGCLWVKNIVFMKGWREGGRGGKEEISCE